MFRYLKLVILFLLQTKLYATTPVIFNNKHEIINIRNSRLEVFEDKENIFSLANLISSKAFVVCHQDVPNFGISKSSFWLKFEITNKTHESNLLLDLAYPNIDEVELYTISDDLKCQTVKMGKNKLFSQRNYQTPEYVFDLEIPINKTLLCFLKVKSGGQIMVPISLGNPNKILEGIKTENFLIGIYCGVMMIMFFYNLFIYFAIRDKVYLFYVSYILIVGLVQTCLLGYTFQFLWPNSTWLALHSVYLLSAMIGVFTIEFVKVFLQTKKHAPLLHKWFFILDIIYVSYILLDFFDFGAELYFIIQLCAMVLSFFMLFIGIKLTREKSRSAWFFLVAWSFFLVGVFIYAMKDLGILPYNNFTVYTMVIGSAIETVLLSFALADRINILKKEKEQSQTATLLALQENKKLITEQNSILEQKVQERTIELKHTNQELNSTLTHLKETQTQLVNAEKMASLGQLTAGIAHEINNPINFVSANVKPLKLDIKDMLELIEKYEVISPNEASVNEFKEIELFRKKIDIEYVKKEMDALLLGIEDGAKRTAEIVSGLKNFSRLDESDVKEVNINEGIESTLVLLKSAIPPNAEVVTHLGESLIIECLPGKLNQVFMNLFSNALHAIKIKKTDDIKRLIISSYFLEDKVVVSVEDTGIGMTPEVKAKIFDPFFTTKDVGEGTGLGMSIVFKIIESHGAKIEIESEYGVGTKMLLILNRRVNPIGVI